MLGSAKKLIQQSLLNSRPGNRRDVVAINNYSFNIINSFLRLHSFIPLSPWAVSPTGLLHVLNYISTYKPKVIVEFGMGSSTVYIAKLIEQNKLDSVLYSVDHDQLWIENVRAWLRTENIEKCCRLIHAPLESSFSFNAHPVKWYDTRILDSHIPKSEVGFLVIDAPPGDLLYSRAGAFIHFSNEIQNGQVNYFLDDANRKEEMEILGLLGINNAFFLDYVIGGIWPQNFDTRPISLFK